MVFDGWSMRILLDELRTLYDAYRFGRSSPLAEPAFQYADFAAWQRDPYRQAEIDEDLRYWVACFQRPPAPLRLPSDRERPRRPQAAAPSTARIDGDLAAPWALSDDEEARHRS
jgi:hypothetical protein